MTLPSWREEPLSKSHDRAAFDCGAEEMNDYLRRFARQSHVINASKTFCVVEQEKPSRILGFYTVTPGAVPYQDVPDAMRKGLAQHEIGCFKLARIATDLSVAGKGLGGILFGLAGLRCLRVATQAGGLLLLIDARNEQVAAWYERLGAKPLKDRALTLAMSLATFGSR